MKKDADVAQRIVKRIEEDLLDRCSLGWVWLDIADDTKNEIRETWAKIVRRELKKEDKCKYEKQQQEQWWSSSPAKG